MQPGAEALSTAVQLIASAIQQLHAEPLLSLLCAARIEADCGLESVQFQAALLSAAGVLAGAEAGPQGPV